MSNHTNNKCSSRESELELYIKSVIEDVAVPVVAVLGVFGNLIAVALLAKKKRKTTFQHSLLTLALLDIAFLGMILLDHSVDFSNQVYTILFPYFLNPAKNILMSWETFLIMSIAFERLMSVLKPIHYRGYIVRRSSIIHLFIFIILPLMTAIAINIPKFFETKISIDNVTSENNRTSTIWIVEITDLRLNQDYIYYYIFLTRLITTGVVPFLFLISVNVTIFLSMKKSFSTSAIQLNIKNDCPSIERQRSGERQRSDVEECQRLRPGEEECQDGNSACSPSRKSSINLKKSAKILTALVTVYIF